MENKAFRLFLLPLILLLTGNLIFGQENNNITSDTPIEAEISTEESWQILEWIEDEPLFVLKYEVVIEKYSEKKKEYSEINRLMTEDNTPRIHITPLLSTGAYRYKVITYNLIGVPEVESNWETFNIYPAFKPEISNVTVEINKSGTIYLDEINDGLLSVSGKNLFTLQEDEFDLNWTSYFIENKKKFLEFDIIKFNENNRKLDIQLDLKSIDVGTYNIIAKDASGLVNDLTTSSELKIKFRKMVDFDISAGYACPVILFDDSIKQYMNSNVWPLSGVGRMSLLPFKHRYGYLGFGLSGSYSRMFYDADNYSVDGNLITGFGNFIYQLPFYSKPNSEGKRKHFMSLELHGGAGVTFINNMAYHFPHGINSEKFNSLNFSVDAGVLAQIYLTQRIYIEPCVDYVMSLSGENNLGIVVPSISIGRQF